MRLPGAAVRVLTLLIGLAAVLLIAATARGVILGVARRPAAPAAPLQQPAGPPPTAEEYAEAAGNILRPFIERLAAGIPDAASVAATRRALTALTVPAERRDAHLEMVLALSRLEADPNSEEAVRAVREASGRYQ